MIKKAFEKPTLLQLLLSVAAACFALVAFGLFFADAVGDKGGDGLPAFKIAFDVMIDGLHFNARAFFAYLIPLLCAAAVVLPFKEKKVYYAAAFLLLAIQDIKRRLHVRGSASDAVCGAGVHQFQRRL